MNIHEPVGLVVGTVAATPLPDRAQRFVVGVTLRGEFARKERRDAARPLMFVVLDELNKYAPPGVCTGDDLGVIRIRHSGVI